jgi:hypothetical protein
MGQSNDVLIKEVSTFHICPLIEVLLYHLHFRGDLLYLQLRLVVDSCGCTRISQMNQKMAPELRAIVDFFKTMVLVVF